MNQAVLSWEGLRRHRLLRLTRDGWRCVLDRPWDAQSRDCLAHWAAVGLPLVVTRQPASIGAGKPVAGGLPAPLQWERRRIAVQVAWDSVCCFDEFPELGGLLHLLPVEARDAVDRLRADLEACDTSARVHGSYGWQALSGLAYIRPHSDLDVVVQVRDAAQADEVARCLSVCGDALPRLDGELMFPDGSAVAWREWSDWRAGRARAVLVRRLTGVELRHDVLWCEAPVQMEIEA